MKEIYLDNAATTKVSKKVLDAMTPCFTKIYGNASSQHEKGREAYRILEKSRKIIAKSINAKASEIYFTSGGTESNNWALKGIFFENFAKGKNHIITSKIEHDSILKTCRWLESKGAKITYLDVDRRGFIDLNQLKKSITEKTVLVSIIHGNNEIGTIQDLKSIGDICNEKKVLFHTDACQSFTKTEINVRNQKIDLVTLNSHKIHGPKGVGALYIREGTKITPLLHGGGHERGIRSGTENIPGIAGFAKAVQISNKRDIKKMEYLRDKIIRGLSEISGVKINGSIKKRLCNNVNASFGDVEGEAIGGLLESKGIYVSTGSACSSNTLEQSHVLKAIGLSPVEINSSLRISISRYTTEKEIEYFLKVINKTIRRLRAISPLNKTEEK